jgi:ADP-heptose:LPS heptosyltransferase
MGNASAMCRKVKCLNICNFWEKNKSRVKIIQKISKVLRDSRFDWCYYVNRQSKSNCTLIRISKPLSRMDFIYHNSYITLVYSDFLQRHRLPSSKPLSQVYFKESFRLIFQNVFKKISTPWSKVFSTHGSELTIVSILCLTMLNGWGHLMSLIELILYICQLPNHED